MPPGGAPAVPGAVPEEPVRPPGAVRPVSGGSEGVRAAVVSRCDVVSAATGAASAGSPVPAAKPRDL